MGRGGIVLAYLAAVVAPATDRYEDVQVGSVTLRIPFPAGYCKPTGSDISGLERLAAEDKNSITLLSLVECKANPRSRYLLVKTPADNQNIDVERSEAIRQLSAAMERINVRARAEQFQQSLGEKRSQTRGVPTTVQGAIDSRGHDDVCIYIGGQLTTDAGGRRQTQAVASCMTLAGRRFLTLSSYENSTDPDAYKHQLPMLRDMASHIAPPPQ